ncbi:ABC transporter permease [Shewanella maritima]|uniref:ABC transporter permease n=1 Tax=Shewanella maritima TaxID=2520507 RepID=UPI0037365248
MNSLIKREWSALWQDQWQLALLTYLPVLAILSLLWIFSAAMPRHMPVAVVDLDNSQLSRELTRKLNASSTIASVSYANLAEAKAAMMQVDAFALVVFPDDMRKDLLTGHSPIIDVRYNSQFLLVGKLLSSQIQQGLGAGLKDVSLMGQYSRGVPKVQAELNLTPIAMQITPLYNKNSHYQVFLMPAILVAIVQIVMMLTFVNSFTRELRQDSVQQWLQHGLIPAIATKAAVYVPLSILQFCVLNVVLYQYLGLHIGSAFGLLLVAQTLMTLTIWWMVLAIFLLLQDSARVVSFCAALFAPAFPFMGVTFPTHDMPLLALLWRQIMPSSHYIEQHLAIVNYGSELSSLLPSFTSYVGFLLLMPIVVLGGRKLLAANASSGQCSINSQASQGAEQPGRPS